MLNYFNFEEFDSPDEIGSGLPKCQNGKMDLGFLHGRIGSSHLKGFAVDISCTTSVQRTAIIQGLIKTGFTRIGIGKTFIHVDLDNNKQSAIWLY